MLWPPLYGVLTPLCLEITEGLKILHSTSDITGYQLNRDDLQLILCGDRDLAGETVFEGPMAASLLSAEFEGGQVAVFRCGERIALNYSHRHKGEMVLKIRISI